MDSDDLRSILETAGVDVWAFIDTAIAVASSDYPSELKQRRDKIVQALYSATATCNRCSRGGGGGGGNGRGEREAIRHNNSSPSLAAIVEREARGRVGSAAGAGIRRRSPETEEEEEEEEKVDVEEVEEEGGGEEDVDPYAGLFDDEQRRVLEIKQQLEDPDQTEDSLVDLLQTLEDMDITFKALKETDIGRHVNRLRKHPSNDVKRLVKLLVRKWKEIVDEWVRLNPQGEHASSALMADGDSPQQQQKITQNGHHQVPDFAYSPNPHNGSSGSDRNYSEPEVVVRKPKPPVSSSGSTVRREIAAPARQQAQHHSAASTTGHNNQRQQQQQREGNSNFDSDRLASARKRLQESYKEAENAKRQRTIQVMDIHEIPKPKNTFFAKNKGGTSQGRHW